MQLALSLIKRDNRQRSARLGTLEISPYHTILYNIMQSNEMALQQINGSAMNVISMMLICCLGKYLHLCLVSFLEKGRGVVVLNNTASDVTIAHQVEKGGPEAIRLLQRRLFPGSVSQLSSPLSNALS